MNTSGTGVRAKGTSRIQLDFNYAGTRYRPTISAAPTESNLQRARSKLKRIKVRIANGTFSFAAEFRTTGTEIAGRAPSARKRATTSSIHSQSTMPKRSSPIHQDWGEAQGNYDDSASSRDCARPSRSRSWCPTAISSEELLQSRRRA